MKSFICKTNEKLSLNMERDNLSLFNCGNQFIIISYENKKSKAASFRGCFTM